MNDGMDLDTSFLLARLGVTPYTLEDEIGEERNRGRVDDTKPLHPALRLISWAVRGKGCLVLLIKVAIDHLKERLGAAGGGVRQRAGSWDRVSTQFSGFSHLRERKSTSLDSSHAQIS